MTNQLEPKVKRRIELYECCNRGCLTEAPPFYTEHACEYLSDLAVKTGGVNPRGEYGLTPLHIACTSQYEARVDELLLLVAEPSMITADGMTCLYLAACARMRNVVGLLIGIHKCK